MMKNKKEAGFTLIEILVVITVLVILSTFLVPQVGTIRERGRQAKCLGNMRIIGLALHTYAADNSGSFPAGAATLSAQGAFRKLYKIGNVTDKLVFDCPSTSATPAGSAPTTSDSIDLTSPDYKYTDVVANSDQDLADKVLASDRAANHASPTQYNQVMVSGAAKQTTTDPLATGS